MVAIVRLADGKHRPVARSVALHAFHRHGALAAHLAEYGIVECFGPLEIVGTERHISDHDVLQSVVFKATVSHAAAAGTYVRQSSIRPPTPNSIAAPQSHLRRVMMATVDIAMPISNRVAEPVSQ